MRFINPSYNHEKFPRFIILFMLFPFPSFINNFYIIQLITLFLLFFSLMAIFKNYINKNIISPIILQYCFIFLSLAFNISSIIGYYDITTELFRYLIYSIIINGILYYLNDLPNYKVLYYSQVILTIILGVQLLVDILYISPAYDLMMVWFNQAKVNRFVRLPGSFENPNYVSFIVCSAVSFLLIIKQEIKIFHYYFFFLTSVILVVVSGSRTGLITMGLLLLLKEKKVLIPIIIYSGSYLYDQMVQSVRYAKLVNVQNIDDFIAIPNFNIRFNIVFDSIEIISKNYMFGLFETPIQITDNYFIMYLLRYGVIAFVAMLIIIPLKISRSIKQTKYNLFAFTPFLITFILFGITGSFLDNFRLFFFFSFFIILSIKFINKDVVRY
jgi:hypothetical protein